MVVLDSIEVCFFLKAMHIHTGIYNYLAAWSLVQVERWAKHASINRAVQRRSLISHTCVEAGLIEKVLSVTVFISLFLKLRNHICN